MPSEPSDTSPDAADVHASVLRAMDGFQKLALAASLRRRVMRMLAMQYDSQADVIAHMLRGRVSAADLEQVHDMAAKALKPMQNRKDSA